MRIREKKLFGMFTFSCVSLSSFFLNCLAFSGPIAAGKAGAIQEGQSLLWIYNAQSSRREPGVTARPTRQVPNFSVFVPPQFLFFFLGSKGQQPRRQITHTHALCLRRDLRKQHIDADERAR